MENLQILPDMSCGSIRNRNDTFLAAFQVRAELVFHLMALEVHAFVQLDNPVLAHRGRPQKVAPRNAVFGVLQRGGKVADDALHQRLRDVVRHVILVGLAEVGLHNVRQDVKLV